MRKDGEGGGEWWVDLVVLEGEFWVVFGGGGRGSFVVCVMGSRGVV